jgi:hypothetical protein
MQKIETVLQQRIDQIFGSVEQQRDAFGMLGMNRKVEVTPSGKGLPSACSQVECFKPVVTPGRIVRFALSTSTSTVWIDSFTWPWLQRFRLSDRRSPRDHNDRNIEVPRFRITYNAGNIFLHATLPVASKNISASQWAVTDISLCHSRLAFGFFQVPAKLKAHCGQ